MSATSSTIPVFTTVASFREWRRQAFAQNKSVGYVPTMGALHAGHLLLVRRSLAENDYTVISIFVNPAQFAPHEDLATYPRTLSQDLAALEAERVNDKRPSAVFAPNALEMYPSGITQQVADQKGTFVEVAGYSHQMEGQSRPTFFRGVTTVVTKLFNIILPTQAYFGQKDIQQALILKRLCRDLHIAFPEPNKLHIVPTGRDPSDHLALSSRNAYLTNQGRSVAGTLYAALTLAKEVWEAGGSKAECITQALKLVHDRQLQAEKDGLEVVLKLDYIEMNDPETFDVVAGEVTQSKGPPVVLLSGALWVDKTRLIDNIILGDLENH